MKSGKNWLMFLMMVGFVSCRKDISVPNGECEKIFGTWRFVSADGGLAGVTITEQSRGYKETVEFTRKGIVHRWKNGKKEHYKFLKKEKFSFTTANSIYTNALSNQVVTIEGNKTIGFNANADTLNLSDEGADGFHTVYVRE